MAAQKGKDVLLKISDDGTSGGTMVTVAGIRTAGVTFNGSAADISSADSSGRWRELLADTGLRSFSLSGSGVFDDDAAVEDMRGHFMGATESLAYAQIIIPDWGTIECAVHINSFSLTGEHEEAVAFEVSMESAGAVTWTAAA